MEPRFNKPRVFLSHSKADVSFIEQVHIDLGKCQIEPWLYSAEIRHGQPWLDAIFEHGIPTCDAVLVYFTDASLESKMVKKEMDAGILQQLKDKRVAFLPYVDDEARRTKLRADIQALQVPVWNKANYSEVLPRVVAEIWRSYLERTVTSAVKEERVNRLQAELELEKMRKETSNSIFSLSEEADFGYIWDRLNKWITIEVEEITEKTSFNGKISRPVVRNYKLEVKLSTVISVLIESETLEFSSYSLTSFLSEELNKYLSKPDSPGEQKNYYSINEFPDLNNDLLMYGFIDRIYEPPDKEIFRTMSRYRNIYNSKCYRFRYWLAYKNMLPLSIEFGKNIEVTELAV